MPPRLLSVEDLTCVTLAEVLELAERMRADATGVREALAGETLACFFDPLRRSGPTGTDRPVGRSVNRRLLARALLIPRLRSLAELVMSDEHRRLSEEALARRRSDDDDQGNGAVDGTHAG